MRNDLEKCKIYKQNDSILNRFIWRLYHITHVDMSKVN